jgi:hypothetical protein
VFGVDRYALIELGYILMGMPFPIRANEVNREEMIFLIKKMIPEQ